MYELAHSLFFHATELAKRSFASTDGSFARDLEPLPRRQETRRPENAAVNYQIGRGDALLEPSRTYIHVVNTSVAACTAYAPCYS